MIAILKSIVILLLLTLVVQVICAMLFAIFMEIFIWWKRKSMWNDMVKKDPEVWLRLEALRKRINERTKEIT